MNSMSIAARMMSRKGIGYVKSYITLHPDAKVEDLCPCEYGHPHCAQVKNGACIEEVKALLKGVKH